MEKYSYFKAGSIDAEVLHVLVAQCSVDQGADFTSIETSQLTQDEVAGYAIDLFFDEAIAPSAQTAMDELIANYEYEPQSLQEVITEKLMKRIQDADRIIATFGAINILRGLSSAQVSDVVSMCSEITAALKTASYTVAVTKIEELEADGVLVTEALKTQFIELVQVTGNL